MGNPQSRIMEAAMIRSFLIPTLIASALAAQTLEQRLKDAWAHYIQFDLVGDAGKPLQPGLPDALDDMGTAWSAWLEAEGPAALKLPALPAPPSKEAGTPSSRVLGHRGPWTLMGLEVPVPCGSHLFLALFKANGPRWALVMLDLHEARTKQDPVGARENAQTMLLEGPKVVIASMPPWCTSSWSELSLRVEVPGADALSPKVIAHFEDGAYRCADEPSLQLKPDRHGFNVRYMGWAGPDRIFAPRMHHVQVP